MNVAVRRGISQLVAFMAFFLAMVLSNMESITAHMSVSWLWACVLASLVPVLLLDTAWWLNRRARAGSPLSTGESLFLSVLTATAFASAQLGFIHAFNLNTVTDPVVDLIVTIVAVSTIGVGLMILMQARRVEDERRVALLEYGISLELARLEAGEIVQSMQVALHADIDVALEGARMEIEEQLRDHERTLGQEHWPAIAQELRSTAEHTVRPLSKSLWARTVKNEGRLGFIGIVRNIVTQQPFRPLTVVLIYLTATTAESITILGWMVGLLTLLVGIALITIILTAGNRAMADNPRHHAAIFLCTIFIVELTGLLSFPTRSQWGTTPFTWGEFIASVVLGTAVILASSALGTIRTHRDDVARTFRAEIDRELIESHAHSRQIAQLARESARILHGGVQTRLIACAVAIERAAATEDVEAFRAALQEAHAVLAGPLNSSVDESATLLDEVERKVSLWSGLCTIELQIDPSCVDVRGRLARDVGRVVEEGLTNAVRHGGASTIRVEISATDSAVLVIVTDDGSGPEDYSPGLGSLLLDSVSQDWILGAGPTGTRLRVALSLTPLQA